MKGVRSYHHFTFDGKKPGIVAVKKAVDAPSTDMQILKTSKEALCEAGLPEVIPPAGLTEERKSTYSRRSAHMFCPLFRTSCALHLTTCNVDRILSSILELSLFTFHFAYRVFLLMWLMNLVMFFFLQCMNDIVLS